MQATVIISTYNKPDWLEKVLWGYACQDNKDFEIIIADDGSGKETEELIKSFQKNYPVPLFHVWHDAADFQKTKILNIASQESHTPYLIFTDGDCIPRKDFVRTHLFLREKGKFLSGGYCKLPMETSEYITKADITSQVCFRADWLNKIEPLHWKNKLKLNAIKGYGKFTDNITPSTATFNGCNSSLWKEDFISANGFDERMKYGGEDRELGERLENMGVSGKQIRYRAICIHLDHTRTYANKEDWERNNAIRKEVKKNKKTRTGYGINNIE